MHDEWPVKNPLVYLFGRMAWFKWATMLKPNALVSGVPSSLPIHCGTLSKFYTFLLNIGVGSFVIPIGRPIGSSTSRPNSQAAPRKRGGSIMGWSVSQNSSSSSILALLKINRWPKPVSRDYSDCLLILTKAAMKTLQAQSTVAEVETLSKNRPCLSCKAPCPR